MKGRIIALILRQMGVGQDGLACNRLGWFKCVVKRRGAKRPGRFPKHGWMNPAKHGAFGLCVSYVGQYQQVSHDRATVWLFLQVVTEPPMQKPGKAFHCVSVQDLLLIWDRQCECPIYMGMSRASIVVNSYLCHWSVLFGTMPTVCTIRTLEVKLRSFTHRGPSRYTAD